MLRLRDSRIKKGVLRIFLPEAAPRARSRLEIATTRRYAVRTGVTAVSGIEVESGGTFGSAFGARGD
jgi:hypothetical protein